MQDIVIKKETDDSVKETESGNSSELSYEDKLKLVSRIAQPMAPKKLCKKIYKCIKKGKFF